MRNYDEEIDVRHGRVGDEEGPAQFVWRHRLWLIRRIQTRWLETDPWWEAGVVRAARGEYADPLPAAGVAGSLPAEPAAGSPPAAEAEAGLVSEHEVWRVEAANGRTGHEGVYELAHTWGTGRWRLLRVVD